MTTFDRLMVRAEDEPLSRVLPVCRRIAVEIGDEDLARWTRLESVGYTADNPVMTQNTVVPEYRTVGGHWYDDCGRQLLLTDASMGFINETRLRHGVPELEGIATMPGTLTIPDPKGAEIIREHLDVVVTTFRFQPCAVTQVLSNIRLQLHDALMSRRQQIAAIPIIRDVPETEILQLKPGVSGVSIDLKALWRRVVGGRK